MPQFRADRFASIYAFHPLQRLRTQRNRIPILMYHSISDSDESDRHPYYRTTTAPATFDRHLRFLHDSGYRTIGIGDAVQQLSAHPNKSEKVVVITFDDGFEDFYSEAFSLLSKYGYSATMFLPTAYIDRAGVKFRGVKCLTWNQVRELRAGGMQFGSHTATHPQLTSLAPGAIKEELQSSKQKIEDELGGVITSFSYPFAFPEANHTFRRQLSGLLQETGYEDGVSTIIGTACESDDRFSIKRLPVNSCDDLPLLRAKLAGGYDWLHTLQRAAKRRPTLGH